MKQKTTVCAITALVIVGLLTTSAAGVSTTLSQPANRDIKNNFESGDSTHLNEYSDGASGETSQQANYVSVDSIVTALKKNPDSIEQLQNAVKKEFNLDVQMIDAEMQTKMVEASETSVESAYIGTSSGGMRQPYDSFATHPACGDNGDGSMVLGYEYQYRNYSNPPDFDAFDGVIWDGTNDYGENWGGGLYWVDIDTDEPIAYTYPTIDYWGESPSDGGDQWFGTQVDTDHPEDPGFEGTHIAIMRVNPDPTLNTSYSMRTWTGFADTHWDMSMADIACSDGLYFPSNQTSEPWGLCTYIMDNDYTPTTPYNDDAHFFYPVEYQGNNGYALLSWWQDSEECLGTCAYIDDITKSGYGVWDPVDSDSGQRYLLAMQIVDMNVAFNYPEPDENTYAIGWSLTDTDLGLQHPVIAANNGAVVAATEVTNASNPNEVMIAFWYQPEENGTVYLDISSIWYLNVTGGGKIQFPEISHVYGDTFICTMIVENEQLLAITEDGGATWDGLYQWSGDETVIEDYRANELSDDGAISVWEYDDSSGGDAIISLYYSFNTGVIEGDCTYEEGDPVPEEDLSVTLTNQNISKDFSPIISGNHYEQTLLFGLDLWTNSIFRLFATDGYYYNETIHEFISVDQRNVIDLVLDQTPPDIEIIGARSYATHGPVGELYLDLFESPIECRLVPDYVFEFDLSGTVTDVDSPDGEVAIIGGGDTVRVTLYNPIPDQTWYTITLTGDVSDSFTVGMLSGDIDRSGLVSTGDASIIKPHFGQTPSNTPGSGLCEPQFDYDCSGLCSTSDFSQVKPKFGHSLP